MQDELKLKPQQEGNPRRWIEALDVSRRVQLGLLSNPHAGNSRSMRDRLLLSRVMPEHERIATTQNAAAVPDAIESLVCEQGVNVLAVHGGDGTLHTVLNGLWKTREKLFGKSANQAPFPKLLLLHGGTMNMAARARGFSGRLHRVLEKFLVLTQEKTVGDCSYSPLKVLRVSSEQQTLRGLIFGSELVHNAIGLHRHFGDGYLGLTRLLGRAMSGAVFGTREWERLSPLLTPPEGPAHLDDLTFTRYAAVAASTVPLQLAKGWVEALDVGKPEEGFSTKIVLEQNPRKLVGLIPQLIGNQTNSRVLNNHGVEKLVVKGSFTLDGELFSAPSEALCTVTLEESCIPVIRPGGHPSRWP